MFDENEPVQVPWEALDALKRDREPVARPELSVDDLVFVGFNSRIAALDRATGELIWDWTSPQGSGFVALLLEGDQLVVSVSGYTFALDPATGETLWTNLLKGFGYGIPCLVSTAGTTSITRRQRLSRRHSRLARTRRITRRTRRTCPVPSV